MKGVLLLNGLPYAGKIEGEDAYVVCCDGAYSWAKDRVKIDENVGDFDSLSQTPIPLPTKIYPCEKNQTDGEIGLEVLLKKGCKEIVIYGANGGRCDHFLGNLHLLYKALNAGVPATVYTDGESIFLAQQSAVIHGKKGRTISLLPMGGNAHVLQSTGLKYPLNDLILRYGENRGISNVALEDCVQITLQSGVLLVVINEA